MVLDYLNDLVKERLFNRIDEFTYLKDNVVLRYNGSNVMSIGDINLPNSMIAFTIGNHDPINFLPDRLDEIGKYLNTLIAK